MCVDLLFTCIHVLRVCLVPAEARTPMFSRRPASALSHWTIFPALRQIFFKLSTICALVFLPAFLSQGVRSPGLELQKQYGEWLTLKKISVFNVLFCGLYELLVFCLINWITILESELWEKSALWATDLLQLSVLHLFVDLSSER